MGRVISILGLVGGMVLLPCLGCDDLAVPAQPDGGGPTNTGDGGPNGTVGGTLPAYTPPGAVAGQVVQAFSSTLATWATLDTAGKVNSMQWNLPLTAVTALEGATVDSRVWMEVPAEVKRDTGITGIGYDYLSTGHVPAGVYNVAHWEFHVVFQDFKEVQAIDCSDPTLPANSIVPQGWGVLPPPDNCFPSMGIHAISFAAPEFNAQRFTATNLLVFYRGNGKLKDVGAKVASFEPKATVQFLKERKSFTIPLPTLPPGALGRATSVPTTFTANFDSANDVYIITTAGFVPAT